MLDNANGPEGARRQSQVTLNPNVDVVLEVEEPSDAGADTAASIKLSDIQQDSEDPESVLAYAEIEEPGIGLIGSFHVRLNRKVHETKEFIIEHPHQVTAALGTVLLAGTVKLGTLWVRHHTRK